MLSIRCVRLRLVATLSLTKVVSSSSKKFHLTHPIGFNTKLTISQFAGHNLGRRHEPNEDVIDETTAYPYSIFRTVMSSNCQTTHCSRILCFSTADEEITYLEHKMLSSDRNCAATIEINSISAANYKIGASTSVPTLLELMQWMLNLRTTSVWKHNVRYTKIQGFIDLCPRICAFIKNNL